VKRMRRAVRKRVLRWTRARRSLEPEAYARLVDYHVHTRLCGHAVGEPEDYVREAIARGLGEIGFSDHMPLLHNRDPRLSMAPEELPRYVEMVRDLEASVTGIRVRLGIEMDYDPGRMDETWDLASRHDFDYVYGSVHYLEGWGFSDSRNIETYRDKSPDDLYRRYFEVFCEAAEKGRFDVMAHPDIIKKHGITTRLPLGRMYADAADALASAGVAIEINTSGLRRPTVEIYPALPFLMACAGRGVPVTLGSDAHAPREVGMDFDLALRLLGRAGIREIAVFEGRRRSQKSVADLVGRGRRA